jgi:hypothetical protein
MTEEEKPNRPASKRNKAQSEKTVNEPMLTPEQECKGGTLAAEVNAESKAALTTRPRFQFFIVDSGWDGPVAQVVRNNLHMITRFQHDDPLYVLTAKQSIDVLSRHPHLIGKDPILIARDLDAHSDSCETDYRGFHFNMGLIKDQAKAIEGLRVFLHFLAVHRQSPNIEEAIKQKLHREGMLGAIEVLRVGSDSMVA